VNDVRVITKDEVSDADTQAMIDFIDRLAVGGLTVKPEFRTKWWKNARWEEA